MNDEAIFNAARCIASVEERATFLDEACAGNVELRGRLEALLAADGQTDSLLDDPIIAQPTDDFATSIEQPGQTIGRYKLLQKIGEGGFGAVYLAEQQEPVNRRVALKVIKPGMDSRQVIARFEAERQALAMMDHPNIAKVLDAAMTASGRPYFVMELVKGLPITEFCDEQKLSPRERLELFISVCNAIQHAHQKGIIHRDVKPSNILVSLYDGRPVPKVIDFGVAKAVQQRLTEKTVFTQFGQVIGTLEYMSPEQAEMNQLDIDTRADIYSLGAVLYELLTGSTPFESEKLRSAAFDEMLRIIREEEPLRPSHRLSTSHTLANVSAQRHLEPAKLSRLVQGELDWIVMKALDKQRTRRYQTATGLAEDVQRYLADEPVQASPPSATYRICKLVRKFRKTLAVASAFALVLVAATVISSILATKAIDEAEKTEQARAKLAASEAEIRNERDVALRNLRKATALGLAAQAESIRQQSPVRSMLLGLEAVNATRDHHLPVMPLAQAALLDSTIRVGGTPLVGHAGPVKVVRFSPDGRWLVTASSDHSVRVFDLTTANMKSVLLEGHRGSVQLAKISADSRWLVTAGPQLLIVWDLSSPSMQSSAFTWEMKVSAICISPDSRQLVTASEDGFVRLHSLVANSDIVEILPLQYELNELIFVEYSPDGKWLFTTSPGKKDPQARLWDMSLKQDSLRGIELPVAGLTYWAQEFTSYVSADSTHLVTNNGETTILWDLAADDPSESFTEFKSGRAQPMISPDGHWLVTRSLSPRNELRLWDLSAKKPSNSPMLLHGAKGWIMGFSSDARWLIFRDQTVGHPILWDLNADRPTPTVFPAHDGLNSAVISRDGRWFITADEQNLVRVYDLFGTDPTSMSAELRGHDGTEISVASVSANGRWMVTTAGDDPPRLWDLDLGFACSSPYTIPSCLCWSSNRRWWVSATTGDRKVLRRFDGTVDRLLETSVKIDCESAVEAGKISDDGRWLMTRMATNSLMLWKFVGTTAELVRTIEVEPGVFSPDFHISQDGKWIAVSPSRKSFDDNTESEILLWKTEEDKHEPRHTIRVPHDRGALGIGFGGRWVYCCSPAGKLTWWDLHGDILPQVTGSFSHPLNARIPRQSRTTDDQRFLFTIDELNALRRFSLSSDVSLQEPDKWSNVLVEGDQLLAASESGEVILLAQQDVAPRVINLTDSSHSVSLPKLANQRSGAISDDGRWVAIGTDDRSASVWDLESDDLTTPYLILDEHPNAVDAVWFSGDNRRLFTRDQRSTIRIWELDVDAAIESARRLAGRGPTDEERGQYGLD